jgi:hypothetical protein
MVLRRKRKRRNKETKKGIKQNEGGILTKEERKIRGNYKK